MGGTGACPLVGGVGSRLSVGRATSVGVFWGVCELSMTLSLSADEWCYIPVLLVVWHEVSSTRACRHLGGARSWC